MPTQATPRQAKSFNIKLVDFHYSEIMRIQMQIQKDFGLIIMHR